MARSFYHVESAQIGEQLNRPLEKWRDWPLDFGPAFGQPGDVTTIAVSPQCLFRAEKVIATDTANPPGSGTRIMQILVGNRPQRPTAQGSTTCVFFPPNALGNGVRWDTCEKALTISITVSFVVACTFDLSVFGKAVV